MNNILIPTAVGLFITAMTLAVLSPTNDTKYVVNSDAEIIKARVIVSDFDKRLKSVERKLPACKNDKQCIYNTYSFNGFTYTELTMIGSAIVLKSSVMSDIKKTRDIAISPLTIEMGLQPK